MVDQRLYLEDPARESAETEIVSSGTSEGTPYVVLRETVFYPEGGGQPADRGAINGVGVIDVQTVGDDIRHFLASPLEPGPALATIDGARRFDFRQQHSGQHLLTAVLSNRHGLATTSFHLGESYVAIEVAGPAPDPAMLAGFEAEVNREIRADRPVRTRWVKPSELDALGVRSRGLPADQRGDVRLVEIEGIDLNTCGGTHVSHLAELQAIHLIDAHPARGGTRIRFVAGQRIFRMLHADHERNARLKRMLGAGPGDFSGIIEGWVEDRKATAKRIKSLEGELAIHLGRELAAAGGAEIQGPEIQGHVGSGGPAFLKAVASEVLLLRPDAVAVLTAEDPATSSICFLVQAGPDGPSDVSRIGARLRDRLEARGGGRGRVFQGTGGVRNGMK